jgi:hypothetical protein
MNRNSRRSLAALGGSVAAIALVAVVVANAGAAAGPQPSPSAPPVATPKPTPVVTPVPTPGLPDGVFDVDLDIAGDDEVSILVKDESGLVEGIESGRAGDGMSVRWGEAILENVDDDSLRLTWVGLPGDARLEGLVKRYEDGRIVIFVIQREPYENTDALGADRVLVFDFAGAIAADDVQVVVQEGLDTAG